MISIPDFSNSCHEQKVGHTQNDFNVCFFPSHNHALTKPNNSLLPLVSFPPTNLGAPPSEINSSMHCTNDDNYSKEEQPGAFTWEDLDPKFSILYEQSNDFIDSPSTAASRNEESGPSSPSTEEEEADEQDPESTKCSKQNLNRQSTQEQILKNWNNKDDENLIAMAVECRNDWKRVAKRLFKMNSKKVSIKFLKARYKALLSNNKNKERCQFTIQDDIQIVKYVKEYGLDWTKIACHFTGRTPVMLKNRYYSHIKKRNLFDKLLAEVDDLEKECIESGGHKEQDEEQFHYTNPEAIDFSLLLINQTHMELTLLQPDEELHAKITPFVSESENSKVQYGSFLFF